MSAYDVRIGSIKPLIWLILRNKYDAEIVYSFLDLMVSKCTGHFFIIYCVLMLIFFIVVLWYKKSKRKTT